MNTAHLARTPITRIRARIERDGENGGASVARAPGLAAKRYGRNSYRTFSGESERAEQTVRNNQDDGSELFWPRPPLYSPRHLRRTALHWSAGVLGSVRGTCRLASAGILYRHRKPDNVGWPPAAPICERRKNIGNCSSARKGERDGIDVHTL